MSSLSYCGIDCSVCSWKELKNCKTCKEYKGDIWHGVCTVAKCCIGKGLDDCGQCDEFPCGLLMDYSFDQTHGDSGERIANLCGGGNAVIPKCGQCCGSKCVRAAQ